MKRLCLDYKTINDILSDKNNGFTFDQLHKKYTFISRTSLTRIIASPEKYIPQSIPEKLLCRECNTLKDLSELVKKKGTKYGYEYLCKYHKKQQLKNYQQENAEKIRQQQLIYVVENKETIATKQKIYRDNHKEEAALYQKQYKLDNKSKINSYRRAYRKDPCFKIAENLRRRINIACKNDHKSGSAVRDLGCSIEFFKEYIEKLFQPGMTWDNYGLYGWHLDHIIPLSSFDLTNREQFLKACYYTNYQPLWAKDNLSKSDKTPGTY